MSFFREELHARALWVLHNDENSCTSERWNQFDQQCVSPVFYFLFYDVFPILRTLLATERLPAKPPDSSDYHTSHLQTRLAQTPNPSHVQPQPPPLLALTTPHQYSPRLNQPGARLQETEDRLHTKAYWDSSDQPALCCLPRPALKSPHNAWGLCCLLAPSSVL